MIKILKKSFSNKLNDIIKNIHIKEYLNSLKINYFIDNEIANIIKEELINSFNQLSEKFYKKIDKSKLSLIEKVSSTIYHYPFRKQKHKGPLYEEIVKKTNEYFKSKKPILILGLMFTRKNTCPLKTESNDESEYDWAELIALLNLNNYCKTISKFYPYGCYFYILSEGKRFLKAFDLCLVRVLNYQNNLKKIIKNNNLSHLKFFDYEDFVNDHLNKNEKQLRKKFHQEAKEKYEKLFNYLKIDDINLTEKIIPFFDPLNDPENAENNFIPLWRSIRNSLFYYQIKEFSEKKRISYEEAHIKIIKNLNKKFAEKYWEDLKKEIINYSFKKAIIHNTAVLGDNLSKIFPEKFFYPEAFRLSINPKPGSHLGFSLIKETTSRVQPWHGKLFLYSKKNEEKINITCLSSIEARTDWKGFGIINNNKKIFLANDFAFEKIKKGKLNFRLI